MQYPNKKHLITESFQIRCILIHISISKWTLFEASIFYSSPNGITDNKKDVLKTGHPFYMLSSFYTKVFWRAMGSKDFPVAHTQPLQNSLSNLIAQNRIGIHRSHENWRILVILRLGSG